MENYYHVSVRGNNGQGMLYTSYDFIHAINSLALSSHKTDTRVLAYIFLSNHYHLVVATKDAFPTKLVQSFRISLNKAINSRHSGSGSLGHIRYSRKLLVDREDIRDTVAYVLRNAVRHGIISNPFNYPHSPIKIFFSKDQEGELLTDKSVIELFLPHGVMLPKGYKMNKDGLILPSSFVDKEDVESIFGNSEVFIKYMAAQSLREQIKFEKKNHIDNNKLTDVEAYSLLQKETKGAEIASLNNEQKIRIAKTIFEQYHVKIVQLSRILQIPYDVLKYEIGSWRKKKG